MRSYYWILFLFISYPFLAVSQLQSPDNFLPHQLGETFTPHHLLVDYLQHVEINSPNVQLIEYGRTAEGRPLLLAIISTPDNLRKIQDIRENNLRRTGHLEGSIDPDLDRAIVWLSFNVHGNEAAGSESSLGVLYDLANPENSRTQAWLDNTIVLLDPCLNPDGKSRYTHWYRSVSPLVPNPTPRTIEHLEPWPGGRSNHYYFDLNRDWAWQTQQESKYRIETYFQWLPHVHVDVHEQGYNSPYYFAPAARPYHEYINQWQRDFQYTIGRNNAKYFDQEGWLYFTRERFDLYYPSYGDTYPTFTGAVGMTYEQAGIRAGRAILMGNGDTLTLRDRVMHHKTTALATIESSSQHADDLIQNFAAYYQNAMDAPVGKYKTFIIPGDNPPERIKAFTDLLDLNKINYGTVGRATSLDAFNYQTGTSENININQKDLVISAYQPNSMLAQILLEPSHLLEDSLSYDITAWSLPFAYGLKAFASENRLVVTPGFPQNKSAVENPETKRPYAFLAPWRGLSNAHFLGKLLQQSVTVRYATTAFSIEGKDYPAGTLVITRGDNQDMGRDFVQKVLQVAREHEQELTAITTGFSENGPDIGSNAMRLIRHPKIALLYGGPASSYSVGQAWHYLERDLEIPFGLLPAEDMGNLSLEDYNTLIVPEGYYNWKESAIEQLKEWVSDGGRLILIGTANRSVLGRQGFELTLQSNPNAEEQNNKSDIPYSEEERQSISDLIPGAIFKVKVDPTHPLGFGQEEYYFSLKTNELNFAPLSRGDNVGTLGEKDNVVSGFAGYKAQQKLANTLVLGYQNKGSGEVIYWVDNPLFRAFWENGKFFFSNSVFF